MDFWRYNGRPLSEPALRGQLGDAAAEEWMATHDQQGRPLNRAPEPEVAGLPVKQPKYKPGDGARRINAQAKAKATGEGEAPKRRKRTKAEMAADSNEAAALAEVPATSEGSRVGLSEAEQDALVAATDFAPRAAQPGYAPAVGNPGAPVAEQDVTAVAAELGIEVPTELGDGTE